MRRSSCVALVLVVGCGEASTGGEDATFDTSVDACACAPADVGFEAAGLEDAGLPGLDAGDEDAGPTDAGPDDAGPSTTSDAGAETSTDAGAPEPPLPTVPSYSGGTCPTLTWAATSNGSVNRDFPSGDARRQFRLMVPDSYDGSKPLPLLIGFHWLNASSGSFARDAELEAAIAQEEFIALLPDDLENANGNNAYILNWPFAETWGVDPELRFLDDLLACTTQQLNVDRRRISLMGVSAGGLWVTKVATTPRAEHFNALVSISGGLGEQPLFASSVPVFKMEYAPQPNKFPSLVVWGGPFDFFIIDFAKASKKLRDAAHADGHFTVQCEHDKGHGIPPFTPPAGKSKFHAIWTFLRDHPLGLPPASTPYANGLPSAANWPSFCSVVR